MSYDNYAHYKPTGSEYGSYNIAKRITYFDANLVCGDCIRGGFDYCVKANLLGSTFTSSKPEGVCCKDCTTYKNDSAWSCSSNYTDEYLKY
jgi:hypothetical protein